MKLFSKTCFGFCGLKLKIGRRHAVDLSAPPPTIPSHGSVPSFPSRGSGSPIPPRGSGSPIPTHGSGSPIPTRGSGSPIPTHGSGSTIPSRGSGSPIPSRGTGSPIPNPGSGSTIPTPDVVFRYHSPFPRSREPSPSPSPPPTPPSPFRTPSPTQTPSPIRTSSRELFLRSRGYRRRGSPISPVSVALSPLPFSPSRTPSFNLNALGSSSSTAPDDDDDDDLPPYTADPSLGLGSFPYHRFDYGSSRTLAYYDVSTNPRPIGPDDMPLGVVGMVLHFHDEIMRTAARVLHVVGCDFVRHTGRPLTVAQAMDNIDFPAGGTLDVVYGGIVYFRGEETMEAPQGCSVAVPIGGTVIFYERLEWLTDFISRNHH